MARLYDRLAAHGSRPVSLFDLAAHGRSPAEFLSTASVEIIEDVGPDGPDVTGPGAVDRFFTRLASVRSPDRSPAGSGPLDAAWLVVGDDVARFLADFPTGTDLVALLATLVPPFEHTFVDVRGVANPLGFAEWGVLFTATDRTREPVGPTTAGSGQTAGYQTADGFTVAVPEEARWVVSGSVYGSWDGRTQVGPLATARLFLDDVGLLVPTPGVGHGFDWVVGGDPSFDAAARALFDDSADDQVGALSSLLVCGLATLSFMHAKNVDVVERPADARQSRAFRRRHGRPLKDQYVLDISPLRRVFEGDGAAATDGLPKALHICRGHLRTYTSERPLFGRHVGTFWVAAHPRGRRDIGVVDKDYRVGTGAPAPVGRGWVDDDEQTLPAAHGGGSNPDLSGRGWQAHARTLNALAAHLAAAGLVPLRPTPDGPQYDCAWVTDAGWHVAEVKSCTAANEADQVRRGIGQVIDYRHALAEITGRPVRAVLVLEREPASRWVEVCADASVTLTWPAAFTTLTG